MLIDEHFINLKHLSKFCKHDGALIIISTSIIDASLSSLLQANLIENSETAKKLLSPNKGVLGNIHAKNTLCYAMGVLPKQLFNEINKIIEIRNITAHTPYEKTFKSNDIEGAIDKLILIKNPLIKKEKGVEFSLPLCENRKDIFVLTIAVVLTMIAKIQSTISHPKTKSIESALTSPTN